jgi:hypothetical protein
VAKGREFWTKEKELSVFNLPNEIRVTDAGIMFTATLTLRTSYQQKLEK